MDKQMLLRSIPQVDEMLQRADLIFLCESIPRSLVKALVRKESSAVREAILDGSRQEPVTAEELALRVTAASERLRKASGLTPVLNGTGVVIHTNLGRSVLSERALRETVLAARDYCDLEYDLEKGGRGLRHTHIERILTEICSAEAAMVVNNNAAATLLALSALAGGREVVVSRGELIEIGGSFRIPEIMEQSGAVLREVGTTNKTRLSDYTAAFSEEKTAAFMKVHTSNYKILGFTEEVSLEAMAAAGHERNIPVIYDMGSGLLTDLGRFGIDEPTVPQMLKAGADVIMFSGDKLLGGPQAGILVGRRDLIEKMKSHPLARALRVDKMTIAALAATLYEYYDPAEAVNRIPVLRMISASREELASRAERLRSLLAETLPDWSFSVKPCRDQVGGGSAPLVYLEGKLLTAAAPGLSAEVLEKRLRTGNAHVLGRIQQNVYGLSLRCLREEDFPALAEAFAAAKEGRT